MAMHSLAPKFRLSYIRNNPQSCLFTIVYALVTLMLFTWRFYVYSSASIQLAVARACGMVLNFQCATILVLVLRKSMSFMRSMGWARYLPLDHYIYFHKVTGWSIAFFSLLHTVAHLYNFHVAAAVTTINYWTLLFSVHLRIGWLFGAACVSGWILCAVLAVMLMLSMNFIRRSGNFEVFYYSHKLYVLFFAGVFIHAPSYWKWLAIPLALYVFEKCSARIKTMKDQHGLTYAIEGTLLPSKVLRLVIRKPKFFTFNPGDFVFVMVPLITEYEWHPITISSAPEDENITIHIRAVGEWTNRMYNHFEMAQTEGLKSMIHKWHNNLCTSNGTLFDGQGLPIDDDNSRESLAVGQELQVVVVDPTIRLTKAIDFDFQTTKMIIPIPEDCDEDGCNGDTKNTSKAPEQHALARYLRNGNIVETVKTSSGETIELSEFNNNASYKKKVELEEQEQQQSKSNLKAMLNDITKGIESNDIFLRVPLKIRLDGPYGAPSSNIFQHEHAVLVATGIGVTPFASILQSIMYRYTEKKRNCLNCGHIWSEKIPSQRIMNLKKVDFVWINRDQTSFEWFVELLNNLKQQQLAIPSENEDDKRFLDIHMYITGQAEQGAADAAAARGKGGGVLQKYSSQLNWKYGRPDWKQFFANIEHENRGRVTVFYCGRPDLATSLRHTCSDFNFHFRKEVF